MTRPANRVDNYFIWPDGYHRPMLLRERLAWRFGRRVFYRYPTTKKGAR